MADAPENPTDKQQTPAPPKKGRKKLLVAVLAVLLVAGGAGGGFLFFRARLPAAEAKAKAADAEKAPEPKGEKHADERGDEGQLIELSLPEDGEVKQVVELQPFIVNLADENEARYLRMTVSLGVGESGEAKPDPLFTTKVRNAMLAVLTSKRSEDVLTPQGKAALRKELLRAARASAREPEVLAVYITDFIVQL